MKNAITSMSDEEFDRPFATLRTIIEETDQGIQIKGSRKSKEVKLIKKSVPVSFERLSERAANSNSKSFLSLDIN